MQMSEVNRCSLAGTDACRSCTNNPFCKMYADARAFYADVMNFGCKDFAPKQTKINADRIRSMTDEELAHLLIKAISSDCPPNYKKFTGCEKKCDANVVCCWLSWLQREAEDSEKI